MKHKFRSQSERFAKRLIRTVHQKKSVTAKRIVRFGYHCFSISIDIEMSAGAMDQQPVIMLTAEEAIGRKIGQPKQDAKLSNNAMKPVNAADEG